LSLLRKEINDDVVQNPRDAIARGGLGVSAQYALNNPFKSKIVANTEQYLSIMARDYAGEKGLVEIASV
jgi:hypothetical protein